MLFFRHCQFVMVMVLCNGMKQAVVPIDQVGRIVLPKNIREELAIKPGDVFTVSIQGSTVTLTPNKAKSGFIRKGQALVFCATGGEPITAESVQEILDRERAEHEARSVK